MTLSYTHFRRTSFFLFVAIILAALALTANQLYTARMQRLAVSALRERRVSVIYDWTLSHDDNSAVIDPTNKGLLRRVLGNDVFDKVIGLYANAKTLNDDDIRWASHLHDLRSIDFSNNDVGDSGLEAISRLPSVRFLKVNNTRIGDRGVAMLTNLHCLEYLDVSNSGVTNDSIRALDRFPSLQVIEIKGTQMTRDAIDQLRASRPKLVVKQ